MTSSDTLAEIEPFLTDNAYEFPFFCESTSPYVPSATDYCATRTTRCLPTLPHFISLTSAQ